MSSFIQTYGGNVNTMAHSGLAAVKRAEAAGLSIGQIQDIARREGITFGSGAQSYFQQRQQEQVVQGFQSQISSLQASFQQQMQRQAEQFAAQQRQQQLEMERMQQQALEAQTRQAAPEQVAQVSAGVGSLRIVRPGAQTRFSRPELQIKSMNI